MIALIALSALLQLPAGQTRLQCALDDAARPDDGPTRLAIILDVGRRGIQAAEIDGPPLFSSTRGLVAFSGRPDGRGGMSMTSSQPSPRQLRWTARLRGERIELARGGSRINLEPVAGTPGAYAGTWALAPTNMGGNFFMEGMSGAIRCQSGAAGSAAQ